MLCLQVYCCHSIITLCCVKCPVWLSSEQREARGNFWHGVGTFVIRCTIQVANAVAKAVAREILSPCCVLACLREATIRTQACALAKSGGQ